MKKIKITKLEKPLEYRERELNEVKAMKKKLLRDSDWTQIFDSGLTTIEILAWRIWRLQVRSVNVTIDNYVETNKELEFLSRNIPDAALYSSSVKEYPLNIFNSTDVENIINIMIELLVSMKFDIKEANRLISLEHKNIQNILQLLDEILNGYRY